MKRLEDKILEQYDDAQIQIDPAFRTRLKKNILGQQQQSSPRIFYKRVRRMVLAPVVLTAVVVAGILIFTIAPGLRQQSPDGTSVSDSNGLSEPAPDIPTQLYAKSGNTNGVSIGYVKTVRVSKKNNPFMEMAYAQSAIYTPTIFYKNQSGQIAALNTFTKEIAQITTDTQGASKPVFSSASQLLAYEQGDCGLAINNLSTNVTEILIVGSYDSTCYSPSSWSPDGSKLAFIGTRSVNSTELGLVSYGALYVYDSSTKQTLEISAPNGFDSTSSEVFWQDNAHFVADYVKRGQYASILDEGLFIIGLETGTKQKIEFGKNVYPESAQIAGESIFVKTTDGQILHAKNGAEPITPELVRGSDNTGTFILGPGADGLDVTDIYSLDRNNSSFGDEGAWSINQLPVGDAAKKELFRTGTYGATLLGWGYGYDQIIYMLYVNGQSEIRQYTKSTNTEVVLVSDLPLVQQ